MDIPSGKNMEAVAGFEAEELTREKFAELLPRLRETLKYDVLNNAKQTQGERAEGLFDIKQEMKESRAHEHLFVVYEGGRVAGLLAVHTTSMSNVGEGQTLWTAYAGEKQRSILRALFSKAKESLGQHGVRRFVFEAPEESPELRKLRGTAEFRDVIRVRRPDEPEDEEKEPAADNDNETPGLREAA